MHYEKFMNRIENGIYKEGEVFWVCDVRQNQENSLEFYRKLKPTQVICCRKDDGELYFAKPKKDGNPSKSTVSINGPTLYAQPFQIFETEYDCKEEYKKLLHQACLEVDRSFEEYKKKCKEVFGGMLKELQEM